MLYEKTYKNVYNGRPNQFPEFIPNKGHRNNLEPSQGETTGNWFTDNKDYANDFGKKIIKADVKLDNPAIFDAHGQKWCNLTGTVEDKNGDEIEYAFLKSTDELAMDMEYKGYDGLEINNLMPSGKYKDEKSPQEINAFDPDSISNIRIVKESLPLPSYFSDEFLDTLYGMD